MNKSQVIIALAGPLANLTLVCLCLAFWYILPSSYAITRDFVQANLALLVTNLLPCYPLDGGKVLCGLLSKKRNYKASLTLIKALSVCFSALFFLLFIVGFCLGYNLFSLGLFAIFLLCSSLVQTQGNTYSKIGALFSHKTLETKGVEIKRYAFCSTCTLRKVIRRIDKSCLCEILVLDKNSRTLQVISHSVLQDLTLANPLDSTLAEVIRIG